MLRAAMAEEIVVVRTSPLRRRAVEGSLGLLAGLVIACLNGPWLLSLLYTPPSGDALSCGPTVNNALAYFVQLQLTFGLLGGVLVLAFSFALRRMWRKRKEASSAAGA